MPMAPVSDGEVFARIEALRVEKCLTFEEAASLWSAMRVNDLFNLTYRPRCDRNAGNRVLVALVTVTTAGEAKRGPRTALSMAFKTTVRMRHHSTSTGRLGYIAFSESEITRDDARVELKSNDSFEVEIDDWENVWFDSDTNTTKFELITEYCR